MNGSLKFFFLLLPWFGMIGFAFLYIDVTVDQATAEHYGGQSFDQKTEANRKLEIYVSKRRSYETDKEAFEKLGYIAVEQYDGKYRPWINTELGLVKFDEMGFIEKICEPISLLNDPDCPPS
ncbi:hypothetical protein [Robiginitomaculum antarcticum]|uniref:hypothetical protein n=1 Tax=Robiginitomaculum antarcticum TaxID=437507 RepID=UPI000368CA73|nr:hypothetical protein [Robiginitomaculum antarcticum]